jgi:hypothetical protein
LAASVKKMVMTHEEQLLAQYVRERSEPAFRELVAGHIDLVYSTALRAVGGDSHMAQDVAQRQKYFLPILLFNKFW